MEHERKREGERKRAIEEGEKGCRKRERERERERD